MGICVLEQIPVLEERRNSDRMERKITQNSRLKKGFTLAELLIVVAIIAVLVAIGIPIFTSQLEKSREAVDLSDVRSAYAEVMMAALTGDTSATYTKDGSKIYLSSGDYQITVQPLKQKQDGWQTKTPLNIGGVSSEAGQPYWIGVPAANGYCKVTYHVADDYVSFEWSGAADSGNGNLNPDNSGNNGNTENNGNGETNGQPSTPNNWTDLNLNVREYPSSGYIDLELGQVYAENGNLYVITYKFPNADVNWVAPGKPNNEYIFAKYSGTIYTEADEYDKVNHCIANLKPGDIYKAPDGSLYISKIYATNQTTPAIDAATDKWQKIN